MTIGVVENWKFSNNVEDEMFYVMFWDVSASVHSIFRIS